MTDNTPIDLLCQRMTEDMTARKLGPASQKSRLRAYKRFAAWLQRSPDTATADDIRLFQLHLAETGVGTVTRNATMTGLRFLFRVTLRRHDLAFEIYHIKEPQKVPLILNQDEAKRLLAMADTLRNRLLLSLGYGAGLRAGEIVRLKVKHIETEQKIIRIEESKGRKDRYVKLPDEMRGLLRQWWKALLGHTKLETTARYAHVAVGMISAVESPLDRLIQPKHKKARKARHSSKEVQPSA